MFPVASGITSEKDIVRKEDFFWFPKFQREALSASGSCPQKERTSRPDPVKRHVHPWAGRSSGQSTGRKAMMRSLESGYRQVYLAKTGSGLRNS